MLKFINGLLIWLLIIISGEVIAKPKGLSKGDMAWELVKLQKPHELLRLSTEAKLKEYCSNLSREIKACDNIWEILDAIDFQNIISNVYVDIYSENQIAALSEFYKTSTGQKHQKRKLYLALSLYQNTKRTIPQLSKEEEQITVAHQSSELGLQEEKAQLELEQRMVKNMEIILKEFGIKQ